MKRTILMSLLAATVAALPLIAQTRIASDFEIAQMRAQIARSGEFLAQLSGHLNLGDAYASRSEHSMARSEYAEALEIARRERTDARRDSDLTRYSTATSYAALAQAKLGKGPEAFALLEESVRYSSDSAKSWNLYASAMSVLRQPRKAASAARNAVTIAAGEAAQSPTVANQLDLAIYQYALASALLETGEAAEAERLLRRVIASLESPTFDPLERQVERNESFEIYSTARGEAAAYLSLFHRAQLRLAALLESGGRIDEARDRYRRVLERRTDDPTALAAMARLTRGAERERYFAAAFDANPFSMNLIREYRKHLTAARPLPAGEETTGARVRRIVELIAAGEMRAARSEIEAMQLPENETLRTLKAETDAAGEVPMFENEKVSAAELRQLLRAADRIEPRHRQLFDTREFESVVVFDRAETTNGQTVLHTGLIEDVPFRFTEPTAFRGTFAAAAPLRLRYRILGVTESNGKGALLLEPLGLTP